MRWWRRIQYRLRERWYTRGRWPINDRRLRYDACSDVPRAVLQVLQEYRADCGTDLFKAVHDDDLAALVPLLEQGEAIARGEYDDEVVTDAEAWASWLRRVADVLPMMWD